MHESTVGLNDKGNPVRDDPANGGGVRVDGVLSDGTPTTVYKEAQSYYGDLFGIHNFFMEDASFFKLSEARVSYNVPVTNWTKTIKNLNVSVFARNPWLISANTKTWGIDPSELENDRAFYEGGQLPPVRSYGLNVSVGF